LSNLSPEQSSLNKQMYGIVGTQRTAANLIYSGAELQVLGQAGIDVITNPVPGGNYFGARFGHNSSTNPVIQGDNYTRMTNYLAYTFNAGMGRFVGKLQSVQKDDPTRRGAGATLSTFLQNMSDQGQVDEFSVICDLSNNSPSRIALGYMQADVKVRYLSVVEKFLINLEGGQSVQVARQQTTAAA
jgi:phage tail sheath protein FI